MDKQDNFFNAGRIYPFNRTRGPMRSLSSIDLDSVVVPGGLWAKSSCGVKLPITVLIKIKMSLS